MKQTQSRFDSRWLAGLAAVGLAVFLANARHDAAAKSDEEVETAESVDQESGDEQLFAVPEGNREELVDHLRTLLKANPGERTPEEAKEFYAKLSEAILKSADKLLTLEPTETQAAEAHRDKVIALQRLIQLGDEEAEKKLDKLASAARRDPRQRVAFVGWQALLMQQMENWRSMSEGEKLALVDKMVAEMQAIGPNAVHAMVLSSVASQSERFDPEVTKNILKRSIALFEDSDDEEINQTVARMEGTLRRLNLPGNTMDLSGTLLNGDPLDWDSYRGKVVLVDFWATWCGPCIRELPNVLAMYEAYHDQGFEVVGVSLDESETKIRDFVDAREIPWSSLFPAEESERGWNHPMALRYGISGIPTAILIDRDGKVVNMDARGPALRSALQELLGDPPAAETAVEVAEPASEG